ncbi:MAG: glycosyltransferase [Firmicutes bacterium]|nr:glycosyltransferase [Bacillota bacterium]
MKIVTDLGFFILFFPLLMGVVWALFGLLDWMAYERKPQDDPPEVEWPAIALIPCHNEALSIEKTCDALTFIQYPDYEVYFIDDASTDDTAAILKQRVSKNAHYTLVAYGYGRH